MSAGFYGKIPATGDFVGRDLPRVLVQRWDRWMDLALPPALAVGGGDGGRPWAFIAALGVFGPEPVAGVWRLSRDRVGRRFPLLIALPGATPEPADPWYAAAAAVVDAAVEGALSARELAERVAALPRPGRRVLPEEAARFWPAAEPWAAPLGYASIADLAREGLPAMLPPLAGMVPEEAGEEGDEEAEALDALASLIEAPEVPAADPPEAPGGMPEPEAEDPLVALLSEPAPARPAAAASPQPAAPRPAPRPADPLLALLDWAAEDEPAPAPPAPPPSAAPEPEALPEPLPEPEDPVDIDALFDLGPPEPGSPRG